MHHHQLSIETILSRITCRTNQKHACHYHCICGYTLTILPPHTLPYYPRTKHPPLSSFPVGGHWGGTSPLVARRRHLRLARGSADSFCLRAHPYMYHVPPRPHTRPRTHTLPSMQPHFNATSSPPTPLHLIAIFILAMNSLSLACRWASFQQPLRMDRPSA